MRAPRRQYADVLLDRAMAGDLPALIDAGLRWVRTALARRSPRAPSAPTLGTLLVTYRCDLRCRVCDLPARAAARRRAGSRELGTDGLRRVLDDMRAIGVAGVGLTGGEPMLRDDLEALVAHGARRGLHMHLNSDGFSVAERAPALLRAGVRSVNLSLDGPSADVHDTARGRPGSFERVVEGFGALRRARRGRREPRLTAVTVLTRHNVAAVGEVARVALEAGADRLGVIPVHDFGQDETAPDAEALAQGRAALEALRRAGRLDNSAAYLDLLPRAFRGEPSPLLCYAPWSSVVVDCYGDVYPCFPLMERARPVGRIPLAPLWRSASYARARARLASCRDCLWNCHTEMNLALPQGRLALGAGA